MGRRCAAGRTGCAAENIERRRSCRHHRTALARSWRIPRAVENLEAAVRWFHLGNQRRDLRLEESPLPPGEGWVTAIMAMKTKILILAALCMASVPSLLAQRGQRGGGPQTP